VLASLEAHHDVLAVSLPGYGESPPLHREATVPALVDALEEELDAEGWETAHVAGNSLGGWIAAELAARGRARSVVALSPAGLWTRKEFRYSHNSLRTSFALAQEIAPFAEELTRTALGRALVLGQVNARPWRHDPAEAAYALRAFAGSPSFPVTLEWVARTRAMPAGLERIRCPFRVVWGTWDLLLPARQAPRWERLVPGAERLELPRLGHVPMSDDPELSARTILEFTSRAREPEAAGAAAG
jgi:pimeloyl-ACP methyl ester carboxylesterase